VPGLRVQELLRPPRRLERALAELDPADTAVSYVFTRATGDLPFRRQPVSDPDAAAVPDEHSVEPALIREAGDAERDIEREIDPPVARVYDVEAWVSAAADAPDPELDRLAGFRGPERFTSSSRYEGRPGARASGAFDGDPATAWVGRAVPGAAAWLEWRLPEPATIRSLRLRAPRLPARLPSRVRLAGHGRELAVGAEGVVRLPRPVSARAFRLEVVDASVEAVGIAEIEGRGVPRVEIPRRGSLRGRCGDLTVRGAGGEVALRASGRIEDLDAAYPVRARRCGGLLQLPARRQALTARGDTFLPYMVRLRSPARGAEVSRPIGAVVDPGEGDGSSRDDVRLDLTGPARLVLAESFNDGWRASCDGRDLGDPGVAAGFGNGWEVPAGCKAVEFSFAPQRAVELGYLFSGGACVVLLVFLLLRRAQRRPFVRSLPREPGRAGLRGRPLVAAASIALPLAAVVGFVFALRAGAVAFPLLTLLFWRGASLGRLLGAAGALLAIAVPAAYALFPPDDLGGHNSSYATELLGAHWIAVAAVVLLALGLSRMLSGSGRRSIH
jgi:hypothetical protein